MKPIAKEPRESIMTKMSGHGRKAIYRLRSKTVETVFGIINEVLDFRAFVLRGIEKMEGELVCLAYNGKRLHKIMHTG